MDRHPGTTIGLPAGLGKARQGNPGLLQALLLSQAGQTSSATLAVTKVTYGVGGDKSFC